MRCASLWLALAGVASAQTAAETFFETRVRPVLAKNCFGCHTATKMGGLELVSRDALLKGGKSGAAVVAGDPSASLLVRAVRHEHDSLKMPPAGGKLPAAEIEAIERWVKDGAVWPARAAVTPAKGITAEQRQFWAFQPVKPPKPADSIDSLLGPRGPRADARTLIRRVAYDLTGLPPAPEEVEAFVRHPSRDAYAKFVDRQLASPHYGERQARFWLDIARYSDDKLNSTQDEPRPNAFRYRDWVVEAFNGDLPYDRFVKAHLAGDRMGPKFTPALGMYAMSPEFQEDRVDVTTRGFLGLTVACAQCHDHKFDPVFMRDYYALLGVFENTEPDEVPLAEAAIVAEYKARKEAQEKAEALLKEYAEKQANLLADVLAHRAADYLRAARGEAVEGLDAGVLERWKKYVAKKKDDYRLFDEAKSPAAFQALLLAVNKEKLEIDQQNVITLGGSMKRGDLAGANLKSLERERHYLWRDFFGPNGVLYFNEKQIDRFLSPAFTAHLALLRQAAAAAKQAVPEQYPFLHAIKDKKEIKKPRIYLRGNRQTPGDTIEAGFLRILCQNEPWPFTKGSGREELGDALVDPANPLTPRVIANRLWLWRFGEGIVKTPSNFGQLGERPSNPALLDYLAWRLVHEHRWSLKSLHREILLSDAYQAKDFGQRRLDAEALRDSILAVSGLLDPRVGGPAAKLDEKNLRRTLYGFVSRRKLDPMLSLFDFPNPMETSERRIETNVPLQRLFLLNSPLVLKAATALAEKTRTVEDAYRKLFTRLPTKAEKTAGAAFVARNTWPAYLQTLMATDEFLYLR